MPADSAKPLSAFGFLTALKDSNHGWFGGYLLVSTLGRPLEFHCTTPVLPNRAQEILYGDSLEPYVLGELIGQSLRAEATQPVTVVLTDRPEMLAISSSTQEPMAFVQHRESSTENTSSNAPRALLGNYDLVGAERDCWAPAELLSALAPLTVHVDLLEPFQRISDAIREAQRISDPVDEDDHESAPAA